MNINPCGQLTTLHVVRKGEPPKGVVQRLPRQAADAGIRPRLLLLDRGFDSVAVLRVPVAHFKQE